MDNFDILKQNLDIAIDPNAGIGQILAQKHNDYVTEFMSKQGKYVGSPFTAKATYQGVANPGELFLNGALNDVNGLGIITSKLTNDLNDFGIVLQTLSSGDLIHFKDYVGRSCYFVFKSFFAANDNNNNEIYQIDVTPNANNINYTYQANESKICVLELIKNIDYFNNVEIDFFTGNKFSLTNSNDKYNEINCATFVEYGIPNSDPNELILFKLFCSFLGIKVKNFEKIKDFNPKLVIERYTPAKRTGLKGNKFLSLNNYKLQSTNSILIVNKDNNLNIEEEFTRIVKHQILNEEQYFNINIENYFSSGRIDGGILASKLYRCCGSGKRAFKTKKGLNQSTVQSMESKTVNFYHNKTFVHFRLKLEIQNNFGTFASQPLLYFKAIKEFDAPFANISSEAYNRITFQKE
jgi:hypothetical protein